MTIAGVGVENLTPSKDANDLLERKIDGLIEKFKHTYANVKIEKLETINSKELNANGETALGLNVKNLILRLAVIGVVCVILVVMGNVLVYLFNPTINRAGDFSQYKLIFVTEITTIANLADILHTKMLDKN